MSTLHKTSAIILAAGLSERFGYPKVFLKFNEQNTFLDRIVEQYKKAGIEQVIIVINKNSLASSVDHNIPLPAGIKVEINKHPEHERFYSIMLGIRKIADVEFCFIQNVDNPFVDQNLLLRMLQIKDSADYIVPVYQGRGGHPILINRRIIDHLRSIHDHNQNLRDLLKHFHRGVLKCEDEKILYNINLPEDYHECFNLTRRHEGTEYIEL